MVASHVIQTVLGALVITAGCAFGAKLIVDSLALQAIEDQTFVQDTCTVTGKEVTVGASTNRATPYLPTVTVTSPSVTGETTVCDFALPADCYMHDKDAAQEKIKGYTTGDELSCWVGEDKKTIKLTSQAGSGQMVSIVFGVLAIVISLATISRISLIYSEGKKQAKSQPMGTLE